MGHNFAMSSRQRRVVVPPEAEIYTHGHHDSVLRSHRARTAENSAAYLLGSLRAGQSVLDIGCGPGTITADIAARVHPGRVVGLDRAAEVVAEASDAFPETPARALSFVTGDVYALDHGDASFDVVHAHQVLQHLTEPISALREMRRVLRPGGLVAVRDGDYAGFVWAPDDDVLDRWQALYHAVTAANGAEADAGRHLPAWVRAAGFDDMTVTSSTWTFADPGSRVWWGELWAERVVRSGLGQQALAYGLADADELAAMAAAWRRWARSPDAFFAVLHVEVLARR
jgi:SAM-dependent methyltransferase